MRIGIDAHYVGVREGGNERYCENLIRCLAKAPSRNDDLFVFSYQNAARRRIPNNGLTHVPLKRRSIAWQRAIELPIHSWRLDLDVLHVPFNFLPVFRCRKVITIHDLTFVHLPDTHYPLERLRMRVMTQLAARRADHILTVSEFIKRDIVEHYRLAPDLVTVAPNAADRDVFRPLDVNARQVFRKAWRIDYPYLLWVGIMQPRKNVETLVEAFARLRAMGRTDHHLVLLGRLGWMYEDVLRLIQDRGLEPVVHRFGEVDAPTLAGFYSEATALVVPSYWESFGLPIIEAMSCGCPVVCSHAAAMPEVYGDAALAFDPAEPDELVDRLIRLLDDSALHDELVRRGFKNADRYSWERTAAIVEGVYHTL